MPLPIGLFSAFLKKQCPQCFVYTCETFLAFAFSSDKIANSFQ